MDTGAWQVVAHGVAKSETWLSNYYLLTHTDNEQLEFEIRNTTTFILPLKERERERYLGINT